MWRSSRSLNSLTKPVDHELNVGLSDCNEQFMRFLKQYIEDQEGLDYLNTVKQRREFQTQWTGNAQGPLIQNSQVSTWLTNKLTKSSGGFLVQ